MIAAHKVCAPFVAAAYKRYAKLFTRGEQPLQSPMPSSMLSPSPNWTFSVNIIRLLSVTTKLPSLKVSWLTYATDFPPFV